MFLISGLAGAEAEPPAPRPNVIHILLDDMGYSDVGSFGGEIETPHIDRLAREGWRFRHFYNAAKCEPTRHMIQSGLYWDDAQPLKKTGWPTLGHVLRDAGYRTLATGKWHLAGMEPTSVGFDRFFGHLSGATDYFHGNDSWRLDNAPFTPSGDFYGTNAITDHSLAFITETHTDNPSQPFYLYLCYSAPHSPLQAPDEDVAKYRGRYLVGWDRLREQRYQRQIELGIIEPDWPLPARPANVPAWDSLTPEQQEFEDHRMAVYAAMMDIVDRNVGRLLDQLDQLGIADNTLILFHSDNGASPYDRSRAGKLGQARSRWNLGVAWANATNTPFRNYKRNASHGGSTSPLIVRWPAALAEPGSIRDDALNIIDLFPTFVKLAGGVYPNHFAGQPTQALPGLDFAQLLTDGVAPVRPEPMFFQFKNHAALMDGDWKALRDFGGPWELYHLPTDGTEVHNLAATEPERLQRMAETWETMANNMTARRNFTNPDHVIGPPKFISVDGRPNRETAEGPSAATQSK